MSGRSYRAAAIGHTSHGGFGHGLDVIFRGLPQVDVVAVADPDDEGRRAAQIASGAGSAFSDYREMLSREEPDLVVIAPRWITERVEMVEAVAAVGAHMFVEKPLAATLADADRMIEACERAGVKMAVAHLGRLHPTVLYAQKLVDAGDIGRLSLVRGYGKMDHRGGLEDLIVLGSHVIDMMRLFAGEATWVSADVVDGSRLTTNADVHAGTEPIGAVAGDGLRATFGFENDVVGMFESFAGLAGDNEFFGIDLTGDEAQLSLRGDHVKRLWRYPRPYVFPGVETWTPVPLPSEAIDEPRPGEPGTGHHRGNQRIVADLLSSIEEDRDPLSSGIRARDALELIQGIVAAHVGGGRVDLPLAERKHPYARIFSGVSGS